MVTPKSANKPRKQAKQARAKRTVDSILAAAARILKRDGLAKLTTNRIADEANLSVGSVYQYFPNKQSILVSLMSAHLDQAMATRPVELDTEASLQKHIEAAVYWHMEIRRKDPLLFQRLFEIQQEVLTRAERVSFEQFHQDSVLQGLGRHRSEIKVRNLKLASLVVSHFILAATQSATANDPTLATNTTYEKEVVSGVMAYLTQGSA